MNPDLARLHPYPFERLRALLSDNRPPAQLAPISLSIGEPRHATAPFIVEALGRASAGLSVYPSTQGTDALRQAIGRWATHRFNLPTLDPVGQILPVAGSREALFAFAQTVVDRTANGPLVVCPNPFYQIYEGAALLAGAQPRYVNLDEVTGLPVYDLTDEEWDRVQLVFVCTPGNPTGAVTPLEQWKMLFERAQRHDFVIASDECYSEIYFDGPEKPLGALDAARQLGLHRFECLIVFSSLSKRSNLPGLRSGFVAGDASLIEAFRLYRTYHGTALSPVAQQVSVLAWNDEAHVEVNRALYRQKFDSVTPIVGRHLIVKRPQAAFYLWTKTPIAAEIFARQLHAQYNVTVLPGSYLARDSHGVNPGAEHVRIALVAGVEECLEAANRIDAFAASL